ncbi:MAG TPA: hypothetical protein VF666_09590 [Pyrinomonadaceae bacterium]|jgi:hypothetical protein
MPNPKRPAAADTRSTQDILREMEELSKSIDSTLAEVAPGASESAHQPKKGGALKSLLGFFVSVEPEEGEASESSAGTESPSSSSSSTTASPAGTRVADLVAGEEHPTFEAPPSDTGEDLSHKPFDEIYAEAGITDAACTVDELAKLMESPSIASQPMNVKVIAVNLALSAKGVGADVPVADAVRRDRALDAYQSMLAERATLTEERNAALLQQLTKETEEFLKRKQAEMEALRAETAEAKRQSVDFALRREAEEKRMAELISPFLEGKPSPLSLGDQSGTGEGRK